MNSTCPGPSTTSPAVIVSGYYGFGNAGDEAVLEGIVTSLRRFCPQTHLTALSATPTRTASQYGVDAIYRNDWREISRRMHSCDLLISGGGSLFQDVTSALSPLYYLNIVRMGLRARKPVMIYGQGVGPLKRRLNRSLARRFINRVSRITVRDNDSREFLRHLGVTVPIHVTADPAFALDIASPDRMREIRHMFGLSDEHAPLIGVALRPWQKLATNMAAIRSALHEVHAKTHCRYIFLPMHFPRDYETMLDLSQAFPSSVIMDHPLSPKDALGVIAVLDLVVSMRLHPLIFAAAEAVPFVGISYDPKVESLCKSFNQLAVPWNSVEEQVTTSILRTWEQRDEIRQFLRERRSGAREAALENARIAMQLLRDHTG